MKNRTSILLGSLLLFASQIAVAQANELLVPLTDKEEAQVRAELETDVAALAQYGKRSRIVRINSNLLASDPDSITISPFSDVSVTLTRSGYSAAPDGTAWEWDGTYSDLAFDKNAFVAEQTSNGIDPHVAGQIFDSNFVVKVFGSTFVSLGGSDHPQPKSAQAYDKESKRWVSMGELKAREADRTGQRNTIEEFVSVTTDVVVYDSNASASEGYRRTYSVRPLPGNPRYHLVYEVDPSKKPHRMDRAPDIRGTEGLERYRQSLNSQGELMSSDTGGDEQ